MQNGRRKLKTRREKEGVGPRLVAGVLLWVFISRREESLPCAKKLGVENPLASL